MQTFIQSKSNCFGWCSYLHATLNQNPLLFHKIGFKPTTTFGTPTHSSSIFSKATRGDTSSTELPVMTRVEDKYSEAGLRRERMPGHVAVILDGNRRWFKQRGLELDYEPFLRHNMLVADLCVKWGIGTTTCFIYALENMRRTQETNELIFRQFEKFLAENLENFIRKNMKVTIIGESSMYPESLKEMIKQVEEATTKFSKLELMFAVCYGGTRDVLHAARSICRNVKDGVVEPEDVSEKLVEQALYTKTSRAPQVDLLIRTGGHLRFSNYLMWQIAEAELYFTNSETMAPNFGEHVFLDALRSYQQTERTFGK